MNEKEEEEEGGEETIRKNIRDHLPLIPLSRSPLILPSLHIPSTRKKQLSQDAL